MDVKLCKFHSNAYESNHYWTKDLWLCNYYFMHLIELNIPILFVWRKKRLESSLDFIIPTRNPKCYWVHKLWINSYKSEFTNLYLKLQTHSTGPDHHTPSHSKPIYLQITTPEHYVKTLSERKRSRFPEEFWKICTTSECPCKQQQMHEIIVIGGKIY